MQASCCAAGTQCLLPPRSASTEQLRLGADTLKQDVNGAIAYCSVRSTQGCLKSLILKVSGFL